MSEEACIELLLHIDASKHEHRKEVIDVFAATQKQVYALLVTQKDIIEELLDAGGNDSEVKNIDNRIAKAWEDCLASMQQKLRGGT
jgi:hypothetical protein